MGTKKLQLSCNFEGVNPGRDDINIVFCSLKMFYLHRQYGTFTFCNPPAMRGKAWRAGQKVTKSFGGKKLTPYLLSN